MKKQLEDLPELRILDTSENAGALHIHSDSSSHTYGAILSQEVKINGKVALYPVAYFSRAHHGAERNYKISEAEMSALVAAVERWSPYLHSGQPVTLHTDSSVAYFTAKNLDKKLNSPSKIIKRLLAALQGISYVVRYQKTEAHPADYFTRCKGAGEPSMMDELPIKLSDKHMPKLTPLYEDGPMKGSLKPIPVSYTHLTLPTKA